MPEETNGTEVEVEAKREIEHVSNPDQIDRFPSETRLTTLIGFGRKADVKYEVYWLVPKTDEECQERYACDLAYLIGQGVRGLSTRPNYPGDGFDKDGNLVPDGHNKMQALADGYKVGRRSAGPTVKAKAAEMDTLNTDLSEAGMTMEELKEMLKKAKAAQSA